MEQEHEVLKDRSQAQVMISLESLSLICPISISLLPTHLLDSFSHSSNTGGVLVSMA